MSIIYDEIKGQYEAMARVKAYVDAQVDGIRATLGTEGSLIFLGCGSSFAVARSAALMAQLKLSRPALALAAGDLLLHLSTYRPLLEGSVLIALSRSGETSEVIRCIDAARAAGIHIRVIGLACAEGTALAARSDLTLEMPWAFDRSVCQTRTVSCLYYACAYAIATLAGDHALRADLTRVVEDGPAYMAANEDRLKDVAQLPWTHGVVLGDAELSGLCEEGALAFKEICQLPSSYYHILDSRHGPMVLIGKDTLVIVVLSGNDAKLEGDLLRDLIAKGAAVVAYSDQPLNMPGITNISFGQTLAHPARGIPAIAICQLITYYKSFLTHANPDQPDGLSPWIKLE